MQASCPIFYLFLQKQLYLRTKSVKIVPKRVAYCLGVYHIPKKIRWPILKEMQHHELLKLNGTRYVELINLKKSDEILEEPA